VGNINTIEGIGIACVLAAAVGGGLKILGVEIPVLQSRSRQAMIAVLGLFLIGSQQPCLPRVIARCPNVGGAWQREVDALTAHIDQTCCKIASTQISDCCTQVLTGAYGNGSFEYTVIRTEKQGKCKVELYGHLTLIDRSDITTEVFGSSGDCGFSQNFTEPLFKWDKR
jgi:hypothetical protein